MREYAKVAPQFWIGDTGRKLRTLGCEAQIVAFYLITSPHANMLGLYYLPLPLLAHETGLAPGGALKGLQRVSEVGFAHYDPPSEWVWVPEMAHYQIGEDLKETDNRVIGINREYHSLPNNPFLKDFYKKYAHAFHLKNSRTFKGPLEPLRSQEQEHEQEQEKDKEKDLKHIHHTSAAKRKGKVLPDTNYTTGFLEWWYEYPSERKVSKPACFEVWKDKDLEMRTGELVEKLQRLKLTTWKHTEARYIKTSLPYLNDNRFEDDLVPLPRFPTQQDSGLSEKEYRTVMASQSLIEEIQREGRRQPTLLSSPSGDGPDIL